MEWEVRGRGGSPTVALRIQGRIAVFDGRIAVFDGRIHVFHDRVHVFDDRIDANNT